MRFPSTTKFLLATGSLLALAACSEADVLSPGSGAPIQPIIIPGGGGGAGALAQNNVPPGGCPAGTTQNNNVDLGDAVVRAFCVLTGTVSGALSLPANGGLPYLISGPVFVGTDGGASGTLTIAPGAVLFGANFDNVASSGTLDGIFVTRGSRIIAAGTPSAPIIFTSQQDLQDDGSANGTGGFGEWGGIAINGFAPINHCTINPAAVGGTAACTKNGEGGSGPFGGDQPADNSGVLSYVRIQHAGFQFSSSNELNALALQGVGSGTQIDHVQLHKGQDDGIEFFGGTVNATFLVITGADDDSFDWTDGWAGNAQFVVAIQDATRGDNGVEGDNREITFDNTPISNPNISNFTLIGRGGSSGEGFQVRAKTNGSFINGIIANFSEGVEWNIQGTAPVPQPVLNAVAVNGNVLVEASSGDVLIAAGANNATNASDTLIGVFPGPNEKPPVITPLNPNTTLGSFFVAANYVGAFGPTETPASNWTTGWTAPGTVPGASVPCPSGTTNTGESVPAGRTESNICRLPPTTTGTVTLVAGNLYEVAGTTFIGQDRGADPAAPISGTQAAVLNIDAGVTVMSNGEANGFDILIVNRGSQIFANGSAAAPVVFTSREQVFSNNGSSGNWGGLYINGRAPINHCTVNTLAVGGTVGCEKTGEAGSGIFGGATPTDNSGRLNYVRIEYAGFQFSGSNEANSLTLQGVGSGTQIDFVQTLFGADDGVEFFGGAVNAKHLVIVGAEDDSIDWTDGWQGKLQFAIVKHDATFAANDNGIEADNREITFDNTPISNPTLSNLTLIGIGAGGEGIQVRAKTNGRILNALVATFTEGLEWNVQGTPAVPQPVVESSIFCGNTTLYAATGATIGGAGPNNNVANGACGLTAHPNASFPLLTPLTTPVAPIDPNTVDGFFTSTSYVGAVQNTTDTWFAGWTRGL